MADTKKNRKNERKIRSYEKRLYVKFPLSYRQFLLEQGSAVIAEYRILGIPKKEEKGKEVEKSPADASKRTEISQLPIPTQEKELSLRERLLKATREFKKLETKQELKPLKPDFEKVKANSLCPLCQKEKQKVTLILIFNN